MRIERDYGTTRYYNDAGVLEVEVELEIRQRFEDIEDGLDYAESKTRRCRDQIYDLEELIEECDEGEEESDA